MKKMLVILVAASAVIPSGARARAAELPIYELMGFPILPHQFSVLGSAHVEERQPVPTLTLNAGVLASDRSVDAAPGNDRHDCHAPDQGWLPGALNTSFGIEPRARLL